MALKVKAKEQLNKVGKYADTQIKLAFYSLIRTFVSQLR